MAEIIRAKPLPPCKAMLLCEKVIVEQGTGNASLIGTFRGMALPAFPGETSRFCVFMHVIDGIGRYNLAVEVHDVAQQQIIAKCGPLPIVFNARPNSGNIIIPVPPLRITHPGMYDVVVTADGQILERQTFGVRALPGPRKK